MSSEVRAEVQRLIKELYLNCSVEEFKDKVNWSSISWSQKLSESFIREFCRLLRSEWLCCNHSPSYDIVL